MLAIGFLKGLKIVIMLTIFLLLFVSISNMIHAFYNYIKGDKDKGIVWWTLKSTLLCLFVYFLYDSYLLIRLLSFASVLSLVVIIFVNLKSKH